MIHSQVGERPVKKLSPDPEEIEWMHAGENMQVEMDHLHIWRCDLQEPGDADVLRAVLSEDEMLRMQRLVVREKRISFLVGRAVLRIILGWYVKTTPQNICFHYLPNGKPVFSDEKLASRIHFNLAHSGRWMVLAVSRRNPVGIDIEEKRMISSMEWALQNLFHEKDQEAIRKISPPLKNEAFLQEWTALEATEKMYGAGLGNATCRGSYLDCIQDAGFSEKKFKMYRKEPCWYVRFSPGTGYCGMAVVETMRKPHIRFYEFAFPESMIR